jgi:uncharacterized protein YutE (UPF0331/DUF86 family)
VVDERRLRRVLQRIADDVATLEGERAAATALLADRRGMAALKYVFITAIEGCIDAAHHACASAGWGPPETNADAIRLLGRHGVLSAELADRLARAVGFRNVLVHGYAEVDDALVVAQLDRVPDLRAFVAGMSALLDGGDEPGGRSGA